MEFKYIKNISEGVGEIRIYDQIGVSVRNGKEAGISGSVFAAEMAHLNSVCNKINIRINSDGGSILDGYGIFASILNSKVETESFIDGVAASTAGWCALAANKCNIADYGSLMVHGASGPEDAELISLANGSIAKMLSNRTGMSEDETKNLMTKETWYKAFDKKDRDTLINKKLVDEIISTGKKIDKSKLTNKSAGKLAEIYNSLNKTNMSKINTLLKLRNDAEDSEQEQAIVKLNSELAEKTTALDEVKNKLKALQDDIAAKETAAKEALKTKATEMVNKFKGSMSDTEVATAIENASRDESSFQFISNILSKGTPGKTAAKVFDLKNVKNSKGESEDRSTWSFTDWSKKDDKGLLKLKNENHEAFTELYNKEFKK